MKKTLIVIAIAAVAVTLAYSQRATIAGRILERGMETRMGADIVDTMEDGLHLGLCGAGGPMPAPTASGPCIVIVAGEKLFMVDAGTDGIRNMARMGYQTGTLQGVFLTHFHSDHIDGLGEAGTIRWAGGDNTQPLPVFGPEGVTEVTKGFNRAYAQDFIYRHKHHGDTVAPLSGAGLEPRPFPVPDRGQLVVVYQDGDLTVEALAVDHAPAEPSVGYKFTYKDRSLLISGDSSKSANILKFAQGVDLLAHDALAANIVQMMKESSLSRGNIIMATITHDIPDYHATPVEAAETARDAGVGHLLYYHIVPPMIVPGQHALFLNGAEDIFPNYTIGQDGVAFSLPAGSTDIIQTSRGL